MDDKREIAESKPISREISNGRQHRCPYDGCGETFRRKLRLQTHIRSSHTGLMPFKCPRCTASFACQPYLNKHLKRHDKEANPVKPVGKPRRSYHCPECPTEAFRTKLQLKQHQATRHGQFPFQCDQCELRFMYRSRLNTHRRRHRGYRCSMITSDNNQCDFRTDKWTDFRRHLATEHPIRPLKCSVCGKTYSSGYYLKLHEQTVHQENGDNAAADYPCQFPDCGRIYSRAGSLKTHIRTNHCEPRFQCEKCLKKFRHKKSLVAHQTKMDICDKPENRKKKTAKKKKKKATKAKLNRKWLRIKPLFDEKRLQEEEEFLTEQDEEKFEQEQDDENDFNLEAVLGSNLIDEHVRTSLIS